MLAAFAAETIEEAKQQNKKVLGVVPPYEVFVDGREGAPLDQRQAERHHPRRVPTGHRGAGLDQHAVADPFAGADRAICQIARTVRGWRRYREPERRAAGRRIRVHEYPAVFAQDRRLPRVGRCGASAPSSPQAPDGVYQAVATLAQRRFGNVAKISFSYRTAIGGEIIGGKTGDRSEMRNPAIIVRLR